MRTVSGFDVVHKGSSEPQLCKVKLKQYRRRPFHQACASNKGKHIAFIYSVSKQSNNLFETHLSGFLGGRGMGSFHFISCSSSVIPSFPLRSVLLPLSFTEILRNPDDISYSVQLYFSCHPAPRPALWAYS